MQGCNQRFHKQSLNFYFTNHIDCYRKQPCVVLSHIWQLCTVLGLQVWDQVTHTAVYWVCVNSQNCGEYVLHTLLPTVLTQTQWSYSPFTLAWNSYEPVHGIVLKNVRLHLHQPP